MSKDIIYREDAIKAINLRARIPHDVASAHYASMAINAIRSVPSADRLQGRNLSEEYPSLFECSVCGASCDDTYPWDCDIKFCPNCGARMYTEMSNDDLLYDECEKIIKAIDAIDDFLIKYSEFWNDITWRSNIDGHELYVDWGYFEEGMREIKNYCKRLK